MTGLREKQKKDRKRRILEAARERLLKTNYRVVTIESIAEAADLSAMTIFNYYGSKGGLLLALVAESDRHLIKKINNVLEQEHKDPLLAVTTFSSTIFDHAFSYLDRQTWAHVLATSIQSGDSTFSRGFMALERELQELLERLLDLLKHQQLVDSEYQSKAAATVIYNVHNARFIEYASNPDISREQINQRIESDMKFIFSRIAN